MKDQQYLFRTEEQYLFKSEWLDLDIPKWAYFGLERAGHFALLNWLHSQYPETPTSHVFEPILRKKQTARWFGKSNNDPTMLPKMISIALCPNADPFRNAVKEIPVILTVRDIKCMMASRFARFAHNSAQCSQKHVDIWVRYAKQALGDKDYFNGNCIAVNYNKWFTTKAYRNGIVELLNEKFGWKLIFNDELINQVARPAGGSSFDKMDYNGRAQQMDVLKRWDQSEHKHLIEPMLTAEVLELNERLFGDINESAGTTMNEPASEPGEELSVPQVSPLRSVHTDSFAELLKQLGISVIVSTYQAGFLIVLRHDGASVNTHFRHCQRPMGLAASGSRLAVGTAREIVQYRNMAEIAAKLEGPLPHDACYLPREVHITGDIDIHEMAWGKSVVGDRWSAAQEPPPGAEADAELWLINTRMSCLCTIDRDHSFVPRWRPRFVSGLSPQDRCHLNGLAMVNGLPRYVTALGETDEAAGWRETKASGGVLIDIASGENIAHGLSMPHSPRWYDGKLWLAESGDGSLGTVNMATGQYEAVGKLDGFTRGLDFIGPYAFVGISQVRESATFSGIPITERLTERICGVSVVDLRNGREVAFVRFEDAVQEVFAVQIVPHRFPEILEQDDDLLKNSYALPDEALKEVSWVKPRE